jgi:hypothetical protein
MHFLLLSVSSLGLDPGIDVHRYYEVAGDIMTTTKNVVGNLRDFQQFQV